MKTFCVLHAAPHGVTHLTASTCCCALYALQCHTYELGRGRKFLSCSGSLRLSRLSTLICMSVSQILEGLSSAEPTLQAGYPLSYCLVGGSATQTAEMSKFRAFLEEVW